MKCPHNNLFSLKMKRICSALILLQRRAKPQVTKAQTPLAQDSLRDGLCQSSRQQAKTGESSQRRCSGSALQCALHPILPGGRVNGPLWMNKRFLGYKRTLEMRRGKGERLLWCQAGAWQELSITERGPSYFVRSTLMTVFFCF